MILLGAGELAGLHARGLRKQERDPILRNARIREETQRAHMRALMTVQPSKFPGGELGRIERFHVCLVRVAPAVQSSEDCTDSEMPGEASGCPARARSALNPRGPA